MSLKLVVILIIFVVFSLILLLRDVVVEHEAHIRKLKQISAKLETKVETVEKKGGPKRKEGLPPSYILGERTRSAGIVDEFPLNSLWKCPLVSYSYICKKDDDFHWPSICENASFSHLCSESLMIPKNMNILFDGNSYLTQMAQALACSNFESIRYVRKLPKLKGAELGRCNHRLLEEAAVLDKDGVSRIHVHPACSHAEVIEYNFKKLNTTVLVLSNTELQEDEEDDEQLRRNIEGQETGLRVGIRNLKNLTGRLGIQDFDVVVANNANLVGADQQYVRDVHGIRPPNAYYRIQLKSLLLHLREARFKGVLFWGSHSGRRVHKSHFKPNDLEDVEEDDILAKAEEVRSQQRDGELGFEVGYFPMKDYTRDMQCRVFACAFAPTGHQCIDAEPKTLVRFLLKKLEKWNFRNN